MKLRAPAVPLITVDPYFSVWSTKDVLNEGTTVHWTGKPNAITGTAIIDKEEYLFMGDKESKKMQQTSIDMDACSTTYTFTASGVELKLIFTSPLLLERLDILARPVSYLKTEVSSLDQKEHEVEIHIQVEDTICLNTAKESPTEGSYCELKSQIPCACMGNIKQDVLNKAGDDIRINWGYFYLTAKAEQAKVMIQKDEENTMLEAVAVCNTQTASEALFVFAYDDIYSLQYFGKNIKGYWAKESDVILEIISRAVTEYDEIFALCKKFSEKLYQDASVSGGEKYAELLALAYRQAIAAHKLCIDPNGELVFISKECFSNGCAATVDVTYPSIPLFLLYQPKLVEGMLRPIFQYTYSGAWPFEFAPHDAGTYPLINGQTYSNGTDPRDQMPIEECGNMLVTITALCRAEQNYEFAKEHMPVLKKWAEYLMQYGADPENQLCTDDFAGHLAHNCNLSVKAILGVASFGILTENLEGKEQSEKYFTTAKEMAEAWLVRAANGDGTYKLTFDQPGTFSMKYNLVWDQIFGLNLFAKELIDVEAKSYLSRMNTYGMPLDNRAKYTKSDWLVWCGSMLSNKEDFEAFIEPLWKAYHESESRVPMTDWYQTDTAKQVGFQNRTVQGGLFIKLLMDRKL
ncbi:MAG: glutaminase [Herbinix sp.]|jgi:hypothetical protein|nr:glutaminase [Herbinix sp.]